MGRLENQLKLVTEKCKIFYKEQLISTPPLLQAFIRYITITFNRREHNIGIIQHTESICFDILSITFSAFFNLLSNSSSTEVFLFWVAFCFAKNRLFGVPLSLHSYATLRNGFAAPTILATVKNRKLNLYK